MISSSRRETLRRVRFRPGLWPSVAVLACLAVLLALGTWQVQRLQWKEELLAERAAQLAAPPAPLPATTDDWNAFDFRRVEAIGVFRHDLEQLFGARAREQRLGHHLLTPLVRSDGSAVLVDRGWVPSDRVDAETRSAGQVRGQIEVTGIGRYRADDRPWWFAPENQPGTGLWFWYDLEAMQDALGLELLPVVIEADAAANPGGLPIGGQTRVELPNNHLQYAITWYGLAAALLGVYISFSLKPREGA